MDKRIIFIVAAISILSLFGGCTIGAQSEDNSGYTAKDLQRCALIEVYSAEDQKLICEIEDNAILAEFNQNVAFAEDTLALDDNEYFDKMEDTKQKLEGYEPQFTIVSYKTPASKNNDGNLEKISEITVYKNTNMIKEQISPDVIKNGNIPSEYMTFYYEVSDDLKDFLISLAGDYQPTFSSQLSVDGDTQEAQYHSGNPRIAKVEIYSDDGLIKTIVDQEQLDEFHAAAIEIDEVYFGQEENTNYLEEKYNFVVYKRSKSIFGNDGYERIFDYTIFANTNVMKVTSNGLLQSIYYEATDDAISYLYSLV